VAAVSMGVHLCQIPTLHSHTSCKHTSDYILPYVRVDNAVSSTQTYMTELGWYSVLDMERSDGTE
jgi:hypothetical protein